MNKIIIAISMILISSSIYTQAGPQTSFYSGGHDSLLFDGAGEITTIPTNRSEDCYVRVVYANGTTNGTYYVTKTYVVCTVQDKYETTETGPLSPMNELKLGEEITTGENSALELQFFDGSRMKIGTNSKVTITGDMCESQTLVNMTGKIWTSVKKLLGSKKYEVKTERAVHGVRGTEFSIETTEEGDITRVYEGSVEVRSTESLRSDKTEDNAKEYAKLTEDYQAGKITMEEFIKKSQEYQKNINKVSEDVKGKMCEAGYMITISGNVGEPVPMEPGSNWFDDENFKK